MYENNEWKQELMADRTPKGPGELLRDRVERRDKRRSMDTARWTLNRGTNTGTMAGTENGAV
jgi:hypothetical protein